MENLEQSNLVRRAASKFNTAKIVKALSLLVLAPTLALSAVSCSTTTQTNPPIVVDGTGSGSSHGQGTTQNSKYSELLTSVLNNEEYKSLIAEAKANPELFESAKFDPHPYGFFEDEGYNVSAIKNGSMPCETMSYVLDDEPNNLYIATRLLVNDEYYATYLLKYELTKKEMADYQMLHGANKTEKYYTIAVFMNDVISQSKQATIIGESKIKKSAEERMEEHFKNNLENAPAKYCNMYCHNLDEETRHFEIVLIPDILRRRDTMNLSGSIGNYRLRSAHFITYENGICTNDFIYSTLIDGTIQETLFFTAQYTDLNYGQEISLNN